jgi:O-antigen ligase
MAARGRDLPRGPRLFTVLLLLNAGSLAVSTAFSSNPSLSLYGGTWRCLGAIVQASAMLFAWLVARESAGRPDRGLVVLRGVAIAAMAIAACGIAQYFGWHPPMPRAAFATWLLMAVFLSLALAKRETERIWRAVAQIAAALAFAALLLTGARAALPGLLAGGLVWLGWRRFRLPRRALAAAALAIVGATGWYFSPLGQRSRAGAQALPWRDSLSMAATRPVAGYGPEVFPGQFPLFESQALAEQDPDSVHESPQNILLDALVSQGVTGLLLLCGLCAVGFSAAWKLAAGWLAAALAAGMVSLQFTAFTVPTYVLFLSTIALAAGLATEAAAPRRSVALTAAAPVLALALLYFAARITLADHSLALTRRLLDARNLPAATAEYETYWFWHLPGASADLWYSRSWMEVARSTSDIGVLEQAMEIAEQAAERATESAGEPSAAWYNLAQISALHQDYDAAENAMRRAIAVRPNWFQPHWMLAQQLRLQSRLEEAEKEAAVAAQLDNGHHPEVAKTLADIRAQPRH